MGANLIGLYLVHEILVVSLNENRKDSAAE